MTAPESAPSSEGAYAVSSTSRGVCRVPPLKLYDSSPRPEDVCDQLIARAYEVVEDDGSDVRGIVEAVRNPSHVEPFDSEWRPETPSNIYPANKHSLGKKWGLEDVLADMLETSKSLYKEACMFADPMTLPRQRRVTKIKDTRRVEWTMVGQGGPHRSTCGGLAEVAYDKRDDSVHYIGGVRWRCRQPSCSECLDMWASDVSSAIARLSCFNQLEDGHADWAGVGLYQIIISPPQEWGVALHIVDGKRLYMDIVKYALGAMGVYGGVILQHIDRHGDGVTRPVDDWRVGPHVHALGYCNPARVMEMARALHLDCDPSDPLARGWIVEFGRMDKGDPSSPPRRLDTGDGSAATVLAYLRSHVSICRPEGGRASPTMIYFGICAPASFTHVVDPKEYTARWDVDGAGAGAGAKERARRPVHLSLRRSDTGDPIVSRREYFKRVSSESFDDRNRKEHPAVRLQMRYAMCFRRDKKAILAEYGEDIDGLDLEAEALRRRDRRIAFYVEGVTAERPPNSKWDPRAHKFVPYDPPPGDVPQRPVLDVQRMATWWDPVVPCPHPPKLPSDRSDGGGGP